MTRPTPEPEYRLNLRLPATWRERIQELRDERKRRTGRALQEADLWRDALELGLQALEEQAQISTPAATRGAPRAAAAPGRPRR